ncbi:MAG: TonB-dependent receptor [Terriglobales bacterium]
MKTWVRLPFAICLATFLCLAAGLSSAQQTTAAIRGQVTDSTGAVVAGATLTLINTGTAAVRTTNSLDTGAYGFESVAIGTYKLTTVKEGFSTKLVDGIVVTVGTTAAVDVSLTVGSTSEQVTVQSEIPLVDTNESHVGTVVDERAVHDLPLQSRQFLSVSVLTPGVTLVPNGDPTALNRLMPSIGGSRARYTNFNVDNADDNEDLDGGLLQTISLEAVQEFQVITHRFSAEQGRAGYGIINVLTKSGTNQFHGSAFEFFRDKALNWKTHTEEISGSPKSSYRRNQFGGSFGGPVVKDRMFGFFAIEKLKQTTIDIVDTQGIDPTQNGSFDVPQTVFTVLGKVDAEITKNNHASLRYSREHNTDTSGVTNLIPKSAWGSNVNTYNTGVFNLTSVIGPTKVNQFTGEFSSWRNELPPNTIGPTLNFPSGVVLGQAPCCPQSTTLTKMQARDTFSLVATAKGTHNLKIGGEYVFTRHPGGTYNIQKLPQYTFLGDSLTAPVSQIFYLTGQGVFEFNSFHRVGLFAQDDWKVSRKLTLNLGMRWDYYTGVAFNQSYSQTYNFLQTVLPEFAGRQTQSPKGNFGPRLGFAYDPVGDGKTVIRGGYGYYYNFPILTSFFTMIERNPDPLRLGYLVVDTSPNQTGITNPDGSLFQYGQPLPPNTLGPSPLPLEDSVVDPRSINPRYQHATIGFERQLSSKTVIGADFIWSRGDHTPFANDINRFPIGGGVRPFAADGYDFPIRIEDTSGQSRYKALNISINHNYSRNLQLTAWYTYSTCGSFGVIASDQGFDNFPINQNDPHNRQGFGPCQFDPNHKFVLSPIFSLPWGFQISSITRFTSGRAYNIKAGSDLNGDGVNNDLPQGVSHINAGTGDNFFQADVRASKIFKLPGDFGRIEGIFEMYNIFNNKNPNLYNGNKLSGTFGQPTAFAGDPLQPEQRLMQLGVRFNF